MIIEQRAVNARDEENSRAKVNTGTCEYHLFTRYEGKTPEMLTQMLFPCDE